MSKTRKVTEAPSMSDEERAIAVRSAVSHCMGLLEAARMISEWKAAPTAWRRSRKIKTSAFDVALRERAFMWVGALAIEKPFVETLARMNRRNTKQWRELKKAFPPDFKKLLREFKKSEQ